MKIHQLLPLVGLVSSGLSGVLAAQDQAPTSKPPALSHEEMLGLMKESLPFELHGGVLFWFWDPSVNGQDNHSEIYYANLLFDAKFGDFGYHFEPRFRDTKLRAFYESNIWIQENYLSWHPLENADSTLKAGKIYTQFGRMWDGVFYGNIPYFDGVKLDPDLGVSWESRVKAGDATNIDYSVQYFTEDGATNGSLQGRDTLSVGTERDIAVGRVAPTFKFGSNSSATVGMSAMHFDADLATGTSSVSRINGEAAVTLGAFTVFGDFTHQNGNHVDDFPLAGSSSDDIDYLMSGVSFLWRDFTFRYSYSSGDYKDENVKEDLHLPGIEYKVNKNLSIWLEYVYWNRDTAGVDAIQDRSVNLILYGSF